jgi:hypothetical protein
MSNLKKSILEHAAQRSEEICNTISSCDWYIELQESIIKKRREIVSKLDADTISKLNEYDLLCLELHCKTDTQIYVCASAEAYVNRYVLTPNLTPK